MTKLLSLYLVLLTVYTLISGTHEKFKNNNTVLTSQALNLDNWVSDKQIILPNEGWNYVLNKLEYKLPISLYNNPDSIIIDNIDYIKYMKTNKAITTPDGYFCMFTSNYKKDRFKQITDLKNKKVGYFDRVDKHIIDAISYGYRIDINTTYLDLTKLSTLSLNLEYVDVVVAYVVPGLTLAKLLARQSLYLLDFENMDLNLINLTYPGVTQRIKGINEIFGVNNIIMSSKKFVNLLSVKLLQVVLGNIEQFYITRLTISKENKDPKYICHGGLTTEQSKQECESPYTVFGDLKYNKTYWDKPCSSNKDCPFYKANKNYPNTRGKCIDGYCEMPLGVNRKGYTKFDPDNKPFCYQCKDKDINCCDNQRKGILKGKTDLKSPDYAFSNDAEDREKNNLPFTILI